MHIIIAGAGDVGYHLATLLSHENQDIALIDTRVDVLEYSGSKLDVLTIQGDCASVSVLERAGVHKASLFLAVTTSEKTNLMAAIIAKRLGAKQTIARISNQEFLEEEHRRLFAEMGIDHLISPASLATEEIQHRLDQNSFTDIYEFEEGNVNVLGIPIDHRSELADLPLNRMPEHLRNMKARPVAILRNHQTLIPKGSTILRSGDLVYFIAMKDCVKPLMNMANLIEHSIRHIMILGGNELAKLTAKALESKYNVTIVEESKQVCRELSEYLDKSLIVQASYGNIDLLKEEGLERMDAFLALTDNSETNIINSILAKNSGVYKTIARVESKEYIQISQNIGVDTLINKKLIAANEIFRFIRKGKIEAISNIMGTDAEIIEYRIHRENQLTRKALKDLHFPEAAIIGLVIRGEDSIIPDGNFTLAVQDKVVVLALPQALNKLDSLFK
jgi:trk system potassium uptake protein